MLVQVLEGVLRRRRLEAMLFGKDWRFMYV